MRKLSFIDGEYYYASGDPFNGVVPRDLGVGDTYQVPQGDELITLKVIEKYVDDDGIVHVRSELSI